MNNILNIMKKELLRFILDKKIAFQIFILPGLLIYVTYSFMGYAMKEISQKEETKKYNIEMVGVPQSVANIKKDKSFKVKEYSADKVKDKEHFEVIKNNAKEKIMSEKLDAFVIFPDAFDEKVKRYNVIESKELPANVEIYYSSDKENSNTAYQCIENYLNEYEKTISNKFDINREKNKNNDKDFKSKYDLAEKKDNVDVKKMMSLFLPMLVIMMIFSGAMASATESIAGEKERGTMATLLVTPVKRTHISLGKILSLSIIAVMSGLSSFVGIILSLPKLMMLDGDVSLTNAYGCKDYVVLIIVICLSACLFTSIIAIVSSFAKNLKDAQTAIAPLTLIIVGSSFLPALLDNMTEQLPLYAVPLINIIMLINRIFSGTYGNAEIIITVVTSIIYIGILACFLGKLFNNEKIIFDK
ncbi:ABC transporter permease [Lachnobacterium bovis]|uniref:ABC transporter permease n=1 Tax=Lachnobacterium bovis TaxID=140626 RepID=UPI00048F260A|nr:ABC transporter permease [Lachnobacterium bovis]